MKRLSPTLLAAGLFLSQPVLAQQAASAPELTHAASKATSVATDDECKRQFESADFLDNTIQLAPVFVACALDKEMNSKDSNCKQQAQAISRHLIWLPLSLENMYGEYVHERRFKEGGILDPNKPSKKGDIKLLYDKTLTVLTKVISVLPENQPYKFQLYLVDDPNGEANAMAMPGGYVYVSLSLAKKLLKKDGEAVVAGFLAHEIGHVTKRHHTKALQSQLVDVATGASQLKAMLKGDIGDLKGLISKVAQAKGFYAFYSTLFSNQYTNQELESDACMTRMTINNPRIDGALAVAKFADYVESHGSADKAGKEGGFFRKSHPQYQDRKRIMQKNASKWRGEKLSYTPVDDPNKFLVTANFSSATGGETGGDRKDEEGFFGSIWSAVKNPFADGEGKAVEPPPEKTPEANTL